jgi:hypothetical protein
MVEWSSDVDQDFSDRADVLFLADNDSQVYIDVMGVGMVEIVVAIVDEFEYSQPGLFRIHAEIGGGT